jgi:hypothetical protein
LTPTLPQQLIDRCVDRFWFADYGGTDFSNFAPGMTQAMALKNIRLFTERVMPALEREDEIVT